MCVFTGLGFVLGVSFMHSQSCTLLGFNFGVVSARVLGFLDLCLFLA